MDVTLSDNDMDDIDQQAIFVSAENSATAFDLRITNNRIGQAAPVDPSLSDAVTIGVFDDARLDVLVDNNAVTANLGFDEVIELYTDGTPAGTPVLNATITNNNFTNSNAAGFDNVVIAADSNGDTVCVNMTGNALAGVNRIELDNFGGGTFNVTQANQAGLGTVNGGATVTTTGIISFSQPACAQPTF